MNAVPVLTYHAIERARTPIAVPPERFGETMRAMNRAGWRTLGLDDLLAGLPDGRWPDRTFALHFDDGFASVLHRGYPVLAECGFTATVFVVGSWVGRRNDWPTQPPAVPRWPLMDWPALRRLRDAGWSIGAHSCSHPRLPALPATGQERELGDAASAIAREIGARPDAFAYPYGLMTEDTVRLAATYYRAAFGTRLGFVNARSRPMALERIDGYYLTPALAAALDTPAARGYLWTRRALRALRQRAVSAREP